MVIKELLENVKAGKTEFPVEIKKQSKLDEICSILQNIFGIYSLSIVEIVEKNEEIILNKTLEICKNHLGTFKVEVERKDKGFAISSQELNSENLFS
ncbi:THUMP domain-containing protein [Spiroplasma floricola]|uniref:tRNA 4-thiouridine(8) synthase ThiI n=1 Tax=Spiroplasma floricola 23-6 TaxID=1336749 RepID=A0A2K8SDF2_9MOLU|nr:THUMP domain-containing protein [Spiroplasma floricola]AUB31497.1 tRNA 4-thiouridine(8) synthase ThiI [Spiroplasma floricola 23-6]